MLRVSRITDYGIVLLTHLTAESPSLGDEDPSGEPGIQNARELAARAALPLPVVSKILKTLARQGLLISHRGARGGYQLARPPESISVAEIIDALEGPIALTECGTEPQGSCSRESRCAVRQPWQQINRELRKTLERVRLSDLARPGGVRPAPATAFLLSDPLPVAPGPGAAAE
jgi:FeS assembly SUF system regulator